MPVLTMQIPYHAIEVNPLTKSELKWSKEYRKVPVVKLDDEVVVDSSAIISRLAAEIEAKGKPAVQPQAAKSSWYDRLQFGALRQYECGMCSMVDVTDAQPPYALLISYCWVKQVSTLFG